MNTVYDRIKTMPKDELQTLIYSIYLWGHINEQCNTDDEYYYMVFLDQPSHNIDLVVKNLEELELVMVREIPIDGGEPRYLSTKFYSDDDAYHHLKSMNPNLVMVDSTTFATPTTVYKIAPCDDGKLR